MRLVGECVAARNKPVGPPSFAGRRSGMASSGIHDVQCIHSFEYPLSFGYQRGELLHKGDRMRKFLTRLLPIIVIALTGASLAAQIPFQTSPPPKLSFEVISIKPIASRPCGT